MYEHFEIDLKEASFEWNEEKDQINYNKHGIHFKTAAKVLFVVCAFKDQNVIRIISARLATVPEKERYEHGEDDF